MIASGASQSLTAPIRLVPQQLSQIHMEGIPSNTQAALNKMPANFHHFGVAAVGRPAEPQALTLQFAANTTVTKISSTRDFKIMQGGTCEEGRSYLLGSTCQLQVLFTPQGAGSRLGKVTIENTTNQIVTLGLLGFASFPVVSFTPSVITTVPATVSSGVGKINAAHNLGIDGGDSLYIPDTGNNAVRYIDSSGVMRSLATGMSGPWGIVVDLFGEVWFSQPNTNQIFEIFDYGPVFQVNGSGTDPCLVATPCTLGNENVAKPGAMATDAGNNIYFTEATRGAALSVTHPEPATLIRLYDPFSYQVSPSSAFGVDHNGNLYSAWALANCQIVGQPLFNAEQLQAFYVSVAGGRTCGFSGDGGQATGAEISKQIGQIAFDLFGNLYFSDSGNNRVRRIDASTGIIRTIAGNGSTGYKGDNGPATGANLGTPSGITVDSQGQVYILTPSSGGAAQVVRKVGTTGELVFPSTVQATHSSVRVVNLANTGINTLSFVGKTITGTNPGDFAVDPNTTNCSFAAGNILFPGQSCQIGVIFTPGAVGSRSAVLNLVDNTIPGVNVVKLVGTGTAVAIVTFTSPLSTQAISSASNVIAKVTVTAAKGPAPTGKVAFSLDGKFVGSVPILSGVASANVGTLVAGSHTLVAAYSGDTYHPPAKASETIKVQ